ncbi:MAG: multiubiquitin domain-containing protein [Georgfuchsia sp.]
MNHEKSFKLIVNKAEKDWPEQFISGAQILTLAGSPSDWVVNQIVPGAGEDPEVSPSQQIDLDVKADPHGIKRFQTRKPKTNPG